MKGLAHVSLVGVLLLSAGCAARPDWIQAMLVTADVTGVWRGSPVLTPVPSRAPWRATCSGSRRSLRH